MPVELHEPWTLLMHLRFIWNLGPWDYCDLDRQVSRKIKPDHAVNVLGRQLFHRSGLDICTGALRQQPPCVLQAHTDVVPILLYWGCSPPPSLSG